MQKDVFSRTSFNSVPHEKIWYYTIDQWDLILHFWPMKFDFTFLINEFWLSPDLDSMMDKATHGLEEVEQLNDKAKMERDNLEDSLQAFAQGTLLGVLSCTQFKLYPPLFLSSCILHICTLIHIHLML